MTKNNTKMTKTKVLDTHLSALQKLTAVTTYSMSLTEAMQHIWLTMARYAVAPVAALTTVVRLILSWRDVYCAKGKGGVLAKAANQTLSASVLGATVIGSLVAGSLFATVAPIMTLAVLGGDVAYHTVMSGYCWLKSRWADPEQKQIYLAQAKKHGINAIASIIVGSLIGTLVMTANTALTIAAIVLSSLATIWGVYRGYIDWKLLRQSAAVAPAPIEQAAAKIDQECPAMSTEKILGNMGFQQDICVTNTISTAATTGNLTSPTLEASIPIDVSSPVSSVAEKAEPILLTPTPSNLSAGSDAAPIRRL